MTVINLHRTINFNKVADKLIIIVLVVRKALGKLIVQDKCMHAHNKLRKIDRIEQINKHNNQFKVN